MVDISCVAIDLGASSGRVVLTRFNGDRLELEELYRFPNEPVRVGDRYYWDHLRLLREIIEGLKIVSQQGENVVSIGIDTWGVDYGLLDRDKNLIGTPIHYRDHRTNAIVDEVHGLMPLDEMYNRTGIQHMPINTVYQLYSDKTLRPEILKNADALLFMPDLFNFYLTGEIKNEYTIASTSQTLNASSRDWAYDLLDTLEIPKYIFNELIRPGQIYGYLKSDIANQVGLPEIPVVAVGSHDTASAVVGTPLKGESSAYLSCGTWSLLGIELKEPVINEQSVALNFTNEGGVDGTIRLLKNINGLWIVQQMREAWNQGSDEASFEDIIDAAQRAKRKHFSIDPDDPRFMAPKNMIGEIVDYCEEFGQGEPEGLGEIAIAVYNGLVSKYAQTVRELEELIDGNIENINMVGGGTRDTLLCQMTANITGKRVISGPIEASVIGNSIVQLMAGNYIEDVDMGRKIIERSFELREYSPGE